jgi:hypothetical protein
VRQEGLEGQDAREAVEGGGFGRGGAPAVAAGIYTVKLTVNGKSYSQPLTVIADPRKRGE